MSGELSDRNAGRWAVARAAMAVLLAGGGFVGSGGFAHAGDEPVNNVGAPGSDGHDVTCVAYGSPPEKVLICNVVGQDGEDGAPGVVTR